MSYKIKMQRKIWAGVTILLWIVAGVLIGAAFSSCAEDVSEPFIKGEQAQVKVIPTFHSPSKRGTTRAEDGLNVSATGFSCLYGSYTGSKQSPDSKAKVMVDDGSSNYNAYAYRVTGSSELTVEGDAPLFPSDIDAVNVYGWYPYTADNSFTIKTDQRETSSYSLSDLMLADRVQCTRDANSVTPAPLTFRHVMSKVKIVLNLAEGVEVKEVRLTNIKPTVTIDDSNKDAVTVGEAIGEARHIVVINGAHITSASDPADKTLAAVFPAQTISAKFMMIRFEINGIESTINYDFNGSAKTFEKGHEYVANITITGSEIGNPTIDISNWLTSETMATVDNRDYLTLESKDPDGTISVQIRSNLAKSAAKTFQYSIDNGITWNNCMAYHEGSATTDFADCDHIFNISTAHKVMFRGNNSSYGETSLGGGERHGTNIFVSDGSAYVYGNVMSLISADDFETLTHFPVDDANYTFTCLFKNNPSIDLHPEKELLLPASDLHNVIGCYFSMFEGCTGLTAAPVLPASTVGESCYNRMFMGCTGLTTAPALPATGFMFAGCYNSMFRDCTGLTTAPALPSMKLWKHCYAEMFRNCTSLTTAPVLPASTVVDFCYDNMFLQCSKIENVHCYATTVAEYSSRSLCFRDWLLEAGTESASPILNVLGGHSGDGWFVPSTWSVQATLTNE